MKKIILAVISVLYFMLPAAGQAAQLDASQAVNVAGSQRMLSQRMVKAYCQLGLGEFYAEPEQQIIDGSALFERNMTSLTPFISNGEAGLAASKVRQHWSDFKALVTTTPSRDNARKLLGSAEQLLEATQKMVEAIQSATGATTGPLVGLAGRQRMLSQRMAMFHMFKIWGISDEASEKLAQQAHREFVEAHNKLQKEPRNTPEITSNLATVGNALKLLDYSLKSQEGLTYTVATTSEKMLKTMDDVTRAYATLEQPAGK